MFDVDNVALDRMAEAQWHRLLNQNMVIEMPADPSVSSVAPNALKAIGDGDGSYRSKEGAQSKEAFKADLNQIRNEVAAHIKKTKGYRIEFLDRTEKIEPQLLRIFKERKSTKESREVAKSIESDPMAYAVQNPDASGETVCMVIKFDRDADIKKAWEENVGGKLAWGNVTPDTIRKWGADHELGHCLNAAGRDVHKSIRLAVSETLADTFAALKAIRDGAPSDTIRFMAAFREHSEWLGATESPYFSSKVLWKIAEEQDTLSKSEKFRNLDVAGLAGLARDIEAKYRMTKDEMIFVRDVRQALGEIGDPLNKHLDLKIKDGNVEQLPLEDWIAQHAEKVPELARVKKVIDAVENGPADLGVYQIDEAASMVSIRSFAKSGDGGAKELLKTLTDRKVAPILMADFKDANLGAKIDLASVLPADQPIQVASAEGVRAAPAKAAPSGPPSDQATRDAGVPDAAEPSPATRDVPEPAIKHPASAKGHAAPATEAAPSVPDSAARKPVKIETQIFRLDEAPPITNDRPVERDRPTTSVEPSDPKVEKAAVTAEQAPVQDISAPLRDLSKTAVVGAAEVERTVLEVIAELTRAEFAKAEAAKADAAKFASRIAMASATKEAAVGADGIVLPPAPSMFDATPKSPSMLNMPTFASLDRTGSWEKSAWLTGSGYFFEDAWSEKGTALAGLTDRDDPHFRGAGFINPSDISRLLDMGRPLEFGRFEAQREFINDIVMAARDTKVDPITLLAMCAQESALGKLDNPRTSSARGPFQFVDGTWLEVVKKHGHKYGLEAEAAKITYKDGKPHVEDPVVKQQILKHRYNTYVASAMAGEMLNESRMGIERRINRSLTTEELYLPHVMGEGGARKLLLLTEGKKKNERADRHFRKEAKANEGLFYKKEGGRRKPVTNLELHERMTDKIAKLRTHFADAIDVLDSGYKTADVQMPEQAISENVMPEPLEPLPDYLFAR